MENQYLEEFKKQSQNQLINLQPADINTFTNQPIKENYTIVVRPSLETIARINEYIYELREIDPHQYYYNPENLHLTIMGEISTNINEQELIEKSKKVLGNYNIRFKLQGIGSNEYCSSINAYPMGFSIHELRTELRNALSQKGTDYSLHLSYYEYVGWINNLRYNGTPPKGLLDNLKKNMNRDFGNLVPGSIGLYIVSSKILDFNRDKMLYKFN